MDNKEWKNCKQCSGQGSYKAPSGSNKMRFDTDECKIIIVGTKNADCIHRMGKFMLEMSISTKVLSIMVDFLTKTPNRML